MSTAELKQLIESIAISQRETDRIVKETSLSIKDTDRQMKETDRKLKELGKQIAPMGQMGLQLFQQLIETGAKAAMSGMGSKDKK